MRKPLPGRCCFALCLALAGSAGCAAAGPELPDAGADAGWSCPAAHTDTWPAECRVEASTGTTYLGQPTEPTGTAATFEFEGFLLKSIDGLACTYCSYSAPAPVSSTETYNCDSYYDCGEDCRLHLAVFMWKKPPLWMVFSDNSMKDCPFQGSWELAEAKGMVPYCQKSCSTAGKPCGSDGCGGECGTCASDETCSSGVCKPKDSCPSGCKSPSGLTCCEPPFCSGDCAGSPCC